MGGRDQPPPTTFVDAVDVVFDATIPYDLRCFQSLDRQLIVKPSEFGTVSAPTGSSKHDMMLSAYGAPIMPNAYTSDLRTPLLATIIEMSCKLLGGWARVLVANLHQPIPQA